jgi:hypothetical protein
MCKCSRNTGTEDRATRMRAASQHRWPNGSCLMGGPPEARPGPVRIVPRLARSDKSCRAWAACEARRAAQARPV